MALLLVAAVSTAITGAAPAAASPLAPAPAVAGPAVAGPDGTSELGQQLSTHWESLSDGIVKVTEYEGGTEAVGILAGCNFTMTVPAPYKDGSRFRSRVTFSATGCSATFVKTHRISDGSLNKPAPAVSSVTNWKAPVSSAVSNVSMSCRKGIWIAELSLDAKSNGYKYLASARRTMSC